MFSSLLTPCPHYVCRCQNNFPFSLLCGMLTGSLTAKPFHQNQSDLAHLYFHISCTDFCLNIPGEVETNWKYLHPWLSKAEWPPATVCFSFQQCLTLPLGSSAYAHPRTPPFPFWDLPPSPSFLISYLWWYLSEGRNAPSNFSLAHYNLLFWGSFWCVTCHPSQLDRL